MIFGVITQTTQINQLCGVPAFAQAFEWIRRLPEDPPDGITELDGRNLYVNVHRYDTRPRARRDWESHRHTADIQYVFAGGEVIDWTPEVPSEDSFSYDAANDFDRWPTSIVAAQSLTMLPGAFVIFLPGELHRPGIADQHHRGVRKLVAKIDQGLLNALGN